MASNSAATRREDMERCRGWAELYLNDPGALPISLNADGERIAGIPEEWRPTSRRRRIDANIVETVYQGRHRTCGLSVRAECLEYADYPVVEWTAWLTNEGTEPTPLLSDVVALNAQFDGASPTLWHCNGDYYSEDGYTGQETPLAPGQRLTFAPTGGRPCDRAFPYYRLMFDGGGYSVAIGWPGQWSASFTGAKNGVCVTAGQQQTKLRLLPGETIRTPRITVLAWSGDGTRAANLWRRWFRDHVMPRSCGKRLGPRLVGHGTDDGEEFTAATEENQVRYLERWAQHGIPIDTWWIDAGWYPCYDQNHERKWWETGTWTPDPERFPNGLKPVSDCAARHGADLLVWFEPERVRPGSELDGSDFLLSAQGQDNRLVNLGNPEARNWLTDHVSGIIKDGGIRIYRQDHNFEPLQHWRENDSEDRQGINENLHVQGYLQYWDDLLARNPNLWIDSCASGGRRNDMETMRRSVPLHYTDYGYGNHPVKLSFHHVLFEWIPYFKEVTLSWDTQPAGRFTNAEDRYAYHCGFGPMLAPAIDIKRDDYDFDLIREMIAIWRRAADLMLNGDYYPLTPIHRTPSRWVARQFDSPERDRGFIQGIRLPECPEETLTVLPHVSDPSADWVFENPETGESVTVTGAALECGGFTLKTPRRAGVIWFYRKGSR